MTPRVSETARPTLLSERMVVNLLGGDGRSAAQIEREEYRIAGSTCVNPPFVLMFRHPDRIDWDQVRPCVAANAWPWVLGPELFLVIDKGGNAIRLELIPVIAQRTPREVTELQQSVIGSLTSSDDVRLDSIASLITEMCERTLAHSRILWLDDTLVFLFCDTHFPQRQAFCEQVEVAPAGTIHLHKDLEGRIRMIDGWVTKPRPRRPKWKQA